MKIIVIGGVAAGMSAASKIRRLDKEADVVVYEQGTFLSYGACGLPYYAAGINPDYRNMIARTQQEFEQLGITVRTQCQVIKVIPEEKTIFVRNLATGDVFFDIYDKLLIATGAKAFVPQISGTNLKQVHVLKTMEDGFRLRESIAELKESHVVVVGGGYIGIEVAETLKSVGKTVEVIEGADRILATFDSEIEKILREHLEEIGIRLHLGERLQEIHQRADGNVDGVVTDKGFHKADIVVLAMGVRPATDFLKGTGIRLYSNGAVWVDREMRSSIPDIYAAGDCATVYSFIEEEQTYIALGTTANKCGRIAGENMLGKHIKYVGTLGSAAIKAGELEAARTGLSEAAAGALKIDYNVSFIKTTDHAVYYPGSEPLWIKVICEKRSRRILGAQAVGRKGAVLRIDVFASAIMNRMTAPELGMTDFCYAPPFAGVWDAVNIAANAVK